MKPIAILRLSLLTGFLLLAVAGLRAHVPDGTWERTVGGTVTDAENTPLIGVTVVVKSNPARGTITDVDGKYQLSVPDDEAVVLVFSYIGYQTQEVAVGQQSNIDISLATDVAQLEEVVVVGYGTQRKQDLTGAIASADLEAFRESPNVNIMQSLQGAVPGVQIGAVNQAGAEPSISIRGQTTIGGSQQPLIVLDGSIYRGRLGDLNPADIKSIDILKDPSSKAIYGAQAANGVIMVTTKGGRVAQKPTIEYTGSVSRNTPSVDGRLLNRDEIVQKIRDIEYKEAYLGPDFLLPNPDWDLSQSELLPALLRGFEAGTNYDWWDALTAPGYLNNHALGLAGGSSNTSYYLSGGYTDQQGIVLNDQYRRATIRLNISTDVTDWLTLGGNTFGTFADFSGSYPNMSTLASTSPLVLPRDADGAYIVNHLGDNIVNPFLNASADDSDRQTNIGGNFFGNVRLPVRGLTYRINYNNNLRYSDHSYSNRYDAGLTGAAFKSLASVREQLLDNILTYDRQFADHGLQATLVAGFNTIRAEDTYARAENIANLVLSYHSLEQGVIQQLNSNAWEEAFTYQMGRINYNYKDRYFLTTTLRRDGFSGFARNNKFAYFPSVGLSWILTRERFFQPAAIDYLKLRASYGRNGNLTGRYSSLARVSAGESSRYVFGDGAATSPGQSVVSLANDDLTWELTSGLNVGLDYGLFDDRLRGSIDYYRTRTTNLLWNVVLPQVSGFSSIRTNLGEVGNTGLELSLEGSLVRSRRFGWDVSVSFAANDNKLVSLLGFDQDGDGREDDLIASGLFIGQSLGTVYGYEIDGIWQVTDEVPKGYFPGTYRIVDQQAGEEYNISPTDDRIILGRTEPAYRFGIQQTLSYGNLTLRLFVNSIQGGRNGYLQANHPYGVAGTPGTAQNSNWFNFYDYWSPTNPDATFPQVWIPAAISPAQYFSRSFIRLQDVALAYRFGNNVTERLGAAGLKVYLSGKNLLTLTKWQGWDPETGQGIGNNGAFPLMRTYTFGVDLSF